MSGLRSYPYKPRAEWSPFYATRARKLREQTRAAIATTGKPIVEVGGPSPEGFAVLGDKPLPAPLIVTNISERHGNVDALADIRNWPFQMVRLDPLSMRRWTAIPLVCGLVLERSMAWKTSSLPYSTAPMRRKCSATLIAPKYSAAPQAMATRRDTTPPLCVARCAFRCSAKRDARLSKAGY